MREEETVVERDETDELRDELDEARDALRRTREGRRRRRLEDNFVRIFGDPDRDIARDDLIFSTGDEEPEITQKKVVASAGDAVVLTGKYLTNVKAVLIGDLEVEQLSVSGEQIAFVVPPDVEPARLTIVWLPADGSEARQVQIDFDLKTSSSNGHYAS